MDCQKAILTAGLTQSLRYASRSYALFFLRLQKLTLLTLRKNKASLLSQ
jgi:hypothetical protein